ncbi:MAG TPA: ABC transporter substrate-binding protein, partial [Haliangium sp.]|nr:ABC transporter substrate-binding protein [Haliangium sp.]
AQQPPAAHVALRLGRVAAHLGKEREARAWLARARDAPAGPDQAWMQAQTRELGAALQGGRPAGRGVGGGIDTALIAVLLPLSGRHALLGNEMRAAIELAAADAGGANAAGVDATAADASAADASTADAAVAQPAGRARLVFLDTAGDPARAVQAVEDAVLRQRAVAILGPVGQQTALVAAARAAELGVPIALLAPADDAELAADAAAGVFRLWSSSAWEAAEAARLAVELGHTRLAVLAPRDEHGGLAATVFAARARALGAEIVASGSYDPTGSELEPDLRAFLGLDPLTNERLRQHLRRHGRKEGWKTFTPDVPFELLYVPDEHERAALVASFLPYYNVEVRSEAFMDAVALRRKHQGRVPQVVQLLGSSGWHHPGLPLRGGPAVEGALVVDIHAGGESEDFLGEEGARFAQSFLERTGRWPGRVAAEAYDAAMLVLAARARIRPGSRSPRADLARALAGAELEPGVCGPARVERGALMREAVLLRVESGTFVLHDF